MLHIANADLLADLMIRSRLPGSTIPWREILMDGPAPAGLTDAEWINVRADHLYKAYGIPRDQVGIALRFQRDALDLTLTEDEVVLWFERDLLCQLHLIYVLTHIARLRLVDPNVTLVMPEWIEDLDWYTGLGGATPEQIMSMFAARRRVTPEMFALAERAFDAFTSPDPRDVEKIAALGETAIPGLGEALGRHLSRFPDTIAGLPHFQRIVLEEIPDDSIPFPDLYSKVNARLHEFGVSDWMVFNEALEIARAAEPLVSMTGFEGEGSPHQAGRIHNASVSITDCGRAALAGDLDHIRVNGLDGWIGGVRLVGHDVAWRWNGDRIVRVAGSDSGMPKITAGATDDQSIDAS